MGTQTSIRPQTQISAAGDEQLRDLGFGTVVSRESHMRLLNRDGTFNVTRGEHLWRTLSSYQLLLTMPWWKFFTVITGVYVGANCLFALAFMACGPDSLLTTANVAPVGRFWAAFFFSVETFATIGYGHIVPSGMAANMLVTVESLVGLLAFALATGLLFSRFSRPTANILYSNHAVVAPYRGVTGWMFRATNARSNQIIELECKVVLARFEATPTGASRKYYVLNLERNKVAFFPLSWTVVHPIDQSSPLYGQTEADLKASHAEFLILLTGIDETFSQSVHSRSSYTTNEIVWGAKFGDILHHPTGDEPITIDVGRLHNIEPVA